MTHADGSPPTGFGRRLRKEDQRFIRGQGLYVDDVRLPGMLHGAVLRSPHPHARILAVDTLAAEAHPKVKAVFTGETLALLNLAWMPTLSGDRQAVLATDKVRFQGQEVAFVVAEDRYSARDALELIVVDYEPLPRWSTRAARWTPARRSSATTSRGAPRTTSSTGRPATPGRPRRCSATPR
jgi:carbon-monoxide dehydrogenase large subunit